MATDVYASVERMVALIRSEERKKCTEFGLQPVHFQMLDYISRCNRFSDTPAALASYLGMTRGTVSQTLLLLNRKDLIGKQIDTQDKRIVHLFLRPKGEVILQNIRATNLFAQASDILNKTDVLSHEDTFLQALLALQKANQSKTFGLCKTCKYFTTTDSGFTCGLTHQSLSQSDSEKLCQEHTV